MMSNTDLTKKSGVNSGVCEGKQFLLLIRNTRAHDTFLGQHSLGTLKVKRLEGQSNTPRIYNSYSKKDIPVITNKSLVLFIHYLLR